MNNPLHVATRPAWQIAIVALSFLVVASGLLLNNWAAGRPVALPNAAHEKLECASYTPSHNGHALGDEATRKLVASDLLLLANRFNCVRTYSVSEGLDTVPKVARDLGLKVILGLWIGSDPANNDKEIEHGIALANQYSDVVTAVVVGNEVLLRRELSAAQLRQLLDRVRRGTSVAVTYADVWEFWLRNPQLADASTFVTVHILPYWEDNPIPIDHAVEHVRSIYTKVQAAFPNKHILIGETGWPSAGRPRLKAMPSLINEARFIREFVVYAEQEKIPYNIIEAFDQPWKRIQEGTVGGYWGLYDADGKEKFPFIGSMTARDSWRLELILALAGATLFAIGGRYLLLRTGTRPTYRTLALLGIAGHAAGSIAGAQWRYMSTANRNWLEWTAMITWSISGWVMFVAICLTLARWLEGTAAARRPTNIADLVRSLGHGTLPIAGTSRLLGVMRALVIVGTAYACLGLDYDGRGRDFPLAMIGLPTLALLLLEFVIRVSVWKLPNEHRAGNEEVLLSVCLLFSATFIAWTETAVNYRAITWSVLCLTLGLLLIAPNFARRNSRRQNGLNPHQSTEQQAGTA